VSKTKKEASELLDVDEDASTKIIQASFRQKSQELRSGEAGPVSKQTFKELNEAFQILMQDREEERDLSAKYVAIISSDVAGYSRLMATYEQETLQFFKVCKEIFEEKVGLHNGRIFNTAGDAILAEFVHSYNAVQCAIEIQKELRALNQGQPEDQRLLFRMGINIGEVYAGTDGDLLGDAVNIAARIQTAAKPGGICVSGSVYDLLQGRIPHTFTALGEKTYKNIPEPVRTYALTENAGKVMPPLPDAKLPSPSPSPQPLPQKRRSVKRAREPARAPKGLLAALAVVVLGGGFYYLRTDKAASTRETSSRVARAPGKIFVGPTPDCSFRLDLDGKTVSSGRTPWGGDVEAGRYVLHLENLEQRISEESDLVVESGKLLKFTPDLRRPASGTLAGAPGHSSSFSTEAPDPIMVRYKERADVDGDAESAYQYGKSRVEKGKFDEAYIYFRIASQHGNGPAQFELGKLFYSGNGVPQRDFDAAIYWLLKASLAGVKDSTRFLMENDKRFPQDFHSYIINQQHIEDHDVKFGGPRTVTIQNAFLDNLQGALRDKGLPN
jgi:class 3 adenylate cyclase